MKIRKILIILTFIIFFSYAFYNASKNHEEMQVLLNETYYSEIKGIVSDMTYDRREDLLIIDSNKYRFMLLKPSNMHSIQGFEVIQKNDSVFKNKSSDTLYVYNNKRKFKSFWILDNPNN